MARLSDENQLDAPQNDLSHIPPLHLCMLVALAESVSATSSTEQPAPCNPHHICGLTNAAGWLSEDSFPEYLRKAEAALL